MNSNFLPNITKKIIVVVGLTIIPLATYSQSIRQSREGVRDDISVVKKSKSRISPKILNNKPKTSVKRKSRKVHAADTVYCIQTKKQHGWFAPVRIITKEEASHRNLTYRFTHRNSQGNWCKMELIDGYGNYTTGGMSPYILKVHSADTDTLANKDWVEKIKTGCIYEFIADPTGKNVIQERVYDKDMNIIYTYSRTPIGTDSLGHNKYVGSYKDSYGLPAEMRKDTTDTYTYGTLVMLTEDVWGNDSIIEYMDAKGLKKPNSDGVAMEVFICDKDGHPLKQQSRDSDGKLIIDNWGNCGIEYVWNPDHTMASATYMDDKWKPMRLPQLRTTGGKDNVIQAKYEYDEYGRQKEESFYTSDGKPDVNSQGIHKSILFYDKHGNVIECKYLDLNDNLVGNEEEWAIYRAEYDKKGNPIGIYGFNPLGQPYYREIIKYNNRGNIVFNEGFTIKDGQETMAFRREITPEYEHNIWGGDGTQRIDSLDSKGRIISRTYLDLHGSPIFDNDAGYHKEVRKYLDNDSKTEIITKRYDVRGNLCGTHPYNIYKEDSVALTSLHLNYNANGNLIGACLQRMDSSFNKPLVQSDVNCYGTVCRAGNEESGVRYYNGKVAYSQKGEFTGIIGRDEFDEPDYIIAGSEVYYYRAYKKTTRIEYDENNQEITDFEQFCNDCPKIMSIEITDSSAYKLGLRDNDVIVSYGDYIWPMNDIINYHDFRTKWALDCVLDSSTSKKMVVFRINPQTLEYGIVEIDNLKGYPSELGFLTHVRFLTQRQYRRIKHTIHKEILSGNPSISEIDFAIKYRKGDKYIIVGIPDMYRSERLQPYAQQITDPTILLGSNIKEKVVNWNITEGIDSLMNFFNKSSRYHSSGKYPQQIFYLSKNLKDIIPLYVNGRVPFVSWLDVLVNDEDYNRIEKLAKIVEKQIEKENSAVVGVKPKQLLGKWLLQTGSDENLKLYLTFEDGNKAQISASSLVKNVACDDVDANIDLTLNLTQIKWSILGTFISFNFEDVKVDCVINSIDVLGISPSDKEEKLPAFRNLVEQNKDLFLSHSDIKDSFDEFRIKSIKSGIMELENLKNEEVLQFKK